jgi:hypothetical protein
VTFRWALAAGQLRRPIVTEPPHPGIGVGVRRCIRGHGAPPGEPGVAKTTEQGGPQVLVATPDRQHPGADLPRRVVPDVLRVAALEIRDPVILFILMKADNPSIHASSIATKALGLPA